MKNFSRFLCCVFVLPLIANEIFGQWTNRYPKLANVSHHVYLEGFNLPTLNQGATDPAVSPDNRTIAFAARGWIWLMDLNAREARRITKSGSIDSRPAWSPDGKQIAFVRDDTKDTSIVLLNVENGRERILIDTPRSTSTRRFPRRGLGIFTVRRKAAIWICGASKSLRALKKALTSDRDRRCSRSRCRTTREFLYG